MFPEIEPYKLRTICRSLRSTARSDELTGVEFLKRTQNISSRPGLLSCRRENPVGRTATALFISAILERDL
jgi:hypothetical protein